MYNFLNKNGQAIGFLSGVAIVFIAGLFAVMGIRGLDDVTKETLGGSTAFDFGLKVTIALVVITLIIMIIFIILSVVKNPKGSMSLIAATIGILVLFFILRGMASGEVTPAMEGFGVTSGQGKIVGGSLSLAIIMTVIAFGALIISELRGMFR